MMLIFLSCFWLKIMLMKNLIGSWGVLATTLDLFDLLQYHFHCFRAFLSVFSWYLILIVIILCTCSDIKTIRACSDSLVFFLFMCLCHFPNNSSKNQVLALLTKNHLVEAVQQVLYYKLWTFEEQLCCRTNTHCLNLMKTRASY